MPAVTDATLVTRVIALRDQEMPRQQIADTLQISLAKLKRIISRNNIPPRPVKPDPVPVQEKNGEVLSPEEGLSLMERCKIILGRRMGEDHRGYLLDSRPASSKQVAVAAGQWGLSVESANKS